MDENVKQHWSQYGDELRGLGPATEEDLQWLEPDRQQSKANPAAACWAGGWSSQDGVGGDHPTGGDAAPRPHQPPRFPGQGTQGL